LSPRKPGSRLWQCHHDILIENGSDARFPVDMVSFSKTFSGKPYATAPWYLDWRPGALDADFGGSVRSYLHSDIDSFRQRFIEGDPAMRQAILADVMIQIVGVTLRQDDCDNLLDTYGDGSVGQQVSHWLGLAFRGLPIPSIARMMAERPSEFHASILATAAVE